MSKKGNENIPGNKFEKSANRMSQRGSYARMRSHERLSGGADAKSKSSASVGKSSTDSNPKVTPVDSDTSRVDPEAEEEVEAILEESSPPPDDKIEGDKKVNEMIDYVIHNLQEAGKALASLGENFEHDLKLMIDELMGKVQNGTSLAHARLDEAKNDLETLRRELLARSNELASKNQEIAISKAKLDEAELLKIAAEKALAENIQKSSEMLQTSTHSAESRKPLSGVSSSGDSPDVGESSNGPSSDTRMGDVSEVQPETESEAPIGAQSGKIQDESAAQMDQSAVQLGGQSGQPGDKSDVEIGDRSDVQLGVDSGKIRSQSGAQVRPRTEDSSRERLSTRGQSPMNVTASAASKIGQRLSEIQESDGETGKLTSGTAQQSSRVPRQQKSDRSSTTDVGVQSRKKDAKRASDLESEVARLRKENERILREKAEYESAIQRALLRGVSSLNAETLKVLKCPPISCYSPCRPPPSPVNAAETMMPCFPKSTRDNWTPRGARTPTNGAQSTQGTVRTRSDASPVPEQLVGYYDSRTLTTGVHRSTSRQKKSSASSDNNSRVSLPHRAEASSVCVSGNTSKSRGNTRAKSKKPESSICVKKLE